MSRRRNAALVALCAGTVLAACVPDGSDDDAAEDESAEQPTISVTVPAVRLTPFCGAMIELSDELRSGAVEDANRLIIDTYRSIQAEVPLELARDFDLVLRALEAGEPPPTDPPAESPLESTVPAVSGSDQPTTVVGSVDEGFDPDTSPSDRINSYVALSCRGTGNNPGPPATEPADIPADDGTEGEGDDDGTDGGG
jgi:hypothetical protein